MSKKEWLIIAAVVIIGGAVTGTLVYKNKNSNTIAGMDHGNMSTQSHATYSIDLMSGKSYLASRPVMLHFAIQDQDGEVLKDFDAVHEKKLHLIVVRKDRTNFQHVHPTLDQNTGMFMIEPFTFPTDGYYRIYADFTASNAQKDEMGMKLAATPYKDVQVGDMSKYTPQSLGSDKLISSTNGFDTNLFLPEGDSPSSGYIAGTTLNLAVSFDKNGVAYKNLQIYLGALGHVVVLGPNLEFIHAHATSEDVANQTGLVTFAVSFPDAGQYKLYLQTQVNNQINTTDYTVTVKLNPNNSSSQSMPGMDHSGH